MKDALAGIVALLAIGILYNFGLPREVEKTENHQYHVFTNIWDEAGTKRLYDLMESRTRYVTAVEDATAAVEHIGEAVPINADGSCSHPYLVPNKNHTLCILPSRIDVGRHFLMTGGYSAHRERYDTLVGRMLPFIGFFFDQLNSTDMQVLFNSEIYKQKASLVCEGRTVFDPIQLSILVMIPGQETPWHWDVPWFFGATRFSLPQWLLIVMQRSGLWKDLRVPQVQGVAYLHRWSNKTRGGGFFFYPEGIHGKDLEIPADHNTGIILDGSEVVHGTVTLDPWKAPVVLNKDDKNELVLAGNSTWDLQVNGKSRARYKTEDLRLSLVWRARCFASEEEKKKWHEYPLLSVDEVLNTLEADVRKKGLLAPNEPRPAPLDFALMLVNEYAKMPFPSNVAIPVNYCMAEAYLPEFAKPFLRAICP